MPDFKIDVGQTIQREGLRFKSANPDTGEIVAIDPSTGEEQFANVTQLMDAQGIPPEARQNVAVVYNAPDSATEESPLSFMDRVQVKGFGNTKGAMEFLKKSYDDVVLDPKKGIVVNNKGLWQRIDPDYLGDGDAWAKTRELMLDIADVADLGLNAAAAGKGAVVGGAMMGPVGAILGAGVGGLAAAGIRTSMGRLSATYNADATEQLGDVAMESLLSMGGQAAAMGIGFVGKQIINGVKGFVNNASPVSKEIMKGVITRVSAQGRAEAVDTLFNQPDDVVNGIANAIQKAGGRNNVAVAVDETAKRKLGVMTNFLERAVEALPAKFRKSYDVLLKDADDVGAVFHTDQMLDEAAKNLNSLGFGKIVPKSGGRQLAEGLVDSMGNAVTSTSPKRVFKFVANAVDDIADETTQVAHEKAIPLINEMVAQLNVMGRKAGTMRGKAGAATLREFEKAVNAIADKAAGELPAVESAVWKAKDAIKASVSKQYTDAGLADNYKKMLATYTNYANDVKIARRVLRGETGAEPFLKQVLAGSGRNQARNATAKNLAELVGPEGDAALQEIGLLHSIETFIPMAPRMSLGQGIAAGTAAAGGSMVNPAVGATVGLATGAASFPRAAAKMVAKGTKLVTAAQGVAENAGKALEPAFAMKDWLVQLPPDKMKAFIADPKLFEGVMRTVMEAPAAADRMKQKIVEGATQQAGLQPQAQ